MNINIKTTHTELTEAMRDAIHNKLETIENFIKPEHTIYVEVDEESKHQSGRFSRVEIRISPGGYYADSNGNDFYEALDLVAPKIKDQLIKDKDKQITLRRRLQRFFKWRK